MNKLIWVYTVAAILALQSGLVFAGQASPQGRAVQQDIRKLLPAI